MPQELARWQAAMKMIQIYGRDAAREAADQSMRFADRGDFENATTWHWIALAIAVLPAGS